MCDRYTVKRCDRNVQEAFIASFEDAYTVEQVHQDGHRIVIFMLTPLPAAAEV
jgi:hypothetical protein